MIKSEVVVPDKGAVEPGRGRTPQREIVDRVVACDLLHSSPALRNLLLFLSEESTREGHGELREQEIGVRVFHRHPGYDTIADNIVRVTVSKLRKRLEEYFSGPGQFESQIVEIPRGQYALVVRERVHAAPTSPSRAERLLRWCPLAACLLLAAVCVRLLIDNRYLSRASTNYQAPAVRALWGTFFRSGRPTEIVLPDTSILMFQELTGRPIKLSDYLAQEYRKAATSPEFSPDLRLALGLLIAHRSTSGEEVRIVRRVLDAGTANGQKVSTVPARDFQVRSALESNVVLIGGRKSNLWIELFEPAMNFQFIVGPSAPAIRDSDAIRNRSPQAGEPEVFLRRHQGLDSDGYALIGLLPGLSHAGSVLVISGTDSGTDQAAGEFLTEEQQIGQLWQRLGRPAVFPFFEAVLEVSALDRSAKEIKLVGVHVHPK